MLPMQKIMHQKVTLNLRPMTSATKPATRAPIRVPIESCCNQRRSLDTEKLTHHCDDQACPHIAEVVRSIVVTQTKPLQKIWHTKEAGRESVYPFLKELQRS